MQGGEPRTATVLRPALPLNELRIYEPLHSPGEGNEIINIQIPPHARIVDTVTQDLRDLGRLLGHLLGELSDGSVLTHIEIWIYRYRSGL